MFGKRNKKIINVVWSVLVVFIIISMMMLYTPIFLGGSGASTPTHGGSPVNPPQETATIEEPLQAENAPAKADDDYSTEEDHTPPPPPANSLDFSAF